MSQGTSRILVIDDDFLMRELLRRSLEKKGFKVTVAPSGEEGLKLIADNQPDLVLCDVIMAGMDGFEVCRRLRSQPRYRAMPVIMLTSLSKVEDVVRGLEAGANDYVPKPFHENELLARIVTHLSYRRIQAETVSIEKQISLGRLTGGLCHEINNPLTVVLGHLEMLLMDEKEERRKRMLGMAFENGKRIQKIIQLMRQYAEPVVRNRASCDINEVLANALSIASLGWSESQINIRRDFTKPLPKVLADEERLQQVFLNLLVNAHQFSPPKSEILLATGVSTVAGDWVIASVRDQGKGIPTENQGRIFDPFWTTKDNWQSPGLGLAVARRIVEEHEGRIEVESTPGQGTTFKVVLPVEGSRPPAPAAAPTAAASSDGSQPQ